MRKLEKFFFPADAFKDAKYLLFIFVSKLP